MDKEIIKAEIEGGLKQVNEDFVIDTFSCAKIGRDVEAFFTFKDGTTETEVEVKWA